MFSFGILRRPRVTAKVASPLPKHLYFFLRGLWCPCVTYKVASPQPKNMYLNSRLDGVVNGCIFMAKCMQQSRKLISRHLLYIASQSQQGKEIHTQGRWKVTPPFEDLLEQEAPP